MVPDPGEGYRLVDVEREGVDLSAEVYSYMTGGFVARGIPGDPYIRGNSYRVRVVDLDEVKYPHWPDVKVSEESLFDRFSEDCGRSPAVIVWGAVVVVFCVGFMLGLCF